MKAIEAEDANAFMRGSEKRGLKSGRPTDFINNPAVIAPPLQAKSRLGAVE